MLFCSFARCNMPSTEMPYLMPSRLNAQILKYFSLLSSFLLLISILIRIRIINILILTIIKILLCIIIVVALLRIRTGGAPIVLLINRIRLLLVDLVVFGFGVVVVFFGARFGFVGAFLFGFYEALDLGDAAYFCYGEGAACGLFGVGGRGAGCAGEGCAEFGGEEVDDCVGC